jgi:hypothetical protein
MNNLIGISPEELLRSKELMGGLEYDPITEEKNDISPELPKETGEEIKQEINESPNHFEEPRIMEEPKQMNLGKEEKIPEILEKLNDYLEVDEGFFLSENDKDDFKPETQIIAQEIPKKDKENFSITVTSGNQFKFNLTH